MMVRVHHQKLYEIRERKAPKHRVIHTYSPRIGSLGERRFQVVSSRLQTCQECTGGAR
jgi:hypothetical protein